MNKLIILAFAAGSFGIVFVTPASADDTPPQPRLNIVTRPR